MPQLVPPVPVQQVSGIWNQIQDAEPCIALHAPDLIHVDHEHVAPLVDDMALQCRCDVDAFGDLDRQAGAAARSRAIPRVPLDLDFGRFRSPFFLIHARI